MILNSWIDLTGKVAAVTGAASGIGRAAALALAERGASVLALDLDEAGLAALAGQVIATHRLDVTSQADWRTVGETIADVHGKLDILVNCAGVALKDSPGDEDLDVYRRTFAINVEGTMLGMAMALGFMRAQGSGAIINISSVAALSGSTLMASYGASKAAVAHLTRSAALDAQHAGHDIRINAIQPGVIGTPMADDLYAIYSHVGPPDVAEKLFAAGRPGRPEEVADLIVFLASERASYISGTTILIDRAKNA
ncbi:MAG: SDR family NAD(P)-dependent oxidoreductase [Novosphingobium sp.]